MKEQIKKLALQAGFCQAISDKEIHSPFREDSDISGLLENFAELLVANIIDQITIVKSNDEVVAVTLTDEEHQIQKVIWEKQIGVQKMKKQIKLDRWDETKADTDQKFLGSIKIVVESQYAKEQLLAAIEHLHYESDIDMDIMAVNALLHLYQEPDCIEVKPNLGA